ncbi:MAG: hypothetical protein Q9168_008156 [Polycauliona sp. 1 TL-2023]
MGINGGWFTATLDDFRRAEQAIAYYERICRNFQEMFDRCTTMLDDTLGGAGAEQPGHVAFLVGMQDVKRKMDDFLSGAEQTVVDLRAAKKKDEVIAVAMGP